jgi:malonyl-CoA O-methyltransferase
MNSLACDKSAVAQSFSGAARRYDSWATAQARVAVELARDLPPDARPTRMVDLGCGTGLLSDELVRRYPTASLLGIDLAPGMIDHCRRRWAEEPRARFVVGDAEDPRVVVPDVDLVASSCASQWFADPAGTIGRWAAALAPGGVLALACLIEGSFWELGAAHREALRTAPRGLAFATPDVMPGLLGRSALRIVHCQLQSLTVTYPSSGAALRSFRQIGAALSGQPGYVPLAPAQVRALLARYDRHRDGANRVPMTHRVQFVVAERPR